MPLAAGATHVQRLSINRGEFMAVLSGLKCLREGLEVHREWGGNGPLIALSDSLLLINVMTGHWEPRVMRPYHDAIQHEAERLQAITGAPIQYVHASDGETHYAHRLVNLYARALRDG